MNDIKVVRDCVVNPGEGKRRLVYHFTTFDFPKLFLDAVYEETLPPGKRKWFSTVVYSRLSMRYAKLKNEKDVAMPMDVIDEAVEIVRHSIFYCPWKLQR